MKKIIASNSRPLRRALCTILLSVTALSVVPRNAVAEPILYAVFEGYSIGKYNATTGAVIQSGFISSDCRAMAFSGKIKNLGNTIFVLTPSYQGPNPSVAQYSMTGAVINLNFVTGLYQETGMAVVGNNLFVAYDAADSGPTVAEYNATTGAVTNANLIVLPAGDVAGPLAASGKSLFFAYGADINGDATPAICEYNVTTGAINSTFILLGLSPYVPTALTVSKNRLYVGYATDSAGGTVGEYDATTGNPINPGLITGLVVGPGGLAVSGDHLLVAEGAEVREYNATTGKLINANFINFGNIGACELVVRGK
ncbi:MAG: hypothetical protein JOZ08_02635 [Verrucomicrobia bacterium]|nr:hypothetical protein [Verrucomicrobiota bacterium]MBV8277957.1 hypothetical protein [Verrucomicrobiota bacterium]